MRSQVAVCGALLALFGACASDPAPTVTDATIESAEVMVVTHDGTTQRVQSVDANAPDGASTRPTPQRVRMVRGSPTSSPTVARDGTRVAPPPMKTPSFGLPMPTSAPSTRPAAVWVIVEDQGPQASAEALAAAKGLLPANAAARAKAIAALGALGADGALAAASHLDHASADVRYCALSAIIATGAPGTVVTSSVLNRIQDADAGVRHQALRALRLLKFQGCDDVTVCLSDQVWTVRYEAARALAAMELTTTAKEALEHASRYDREESVRRECRAALDR